MTVLCCPTVPDLFSAALNMTRHICSPRQGSHPSARPVPATFWFQSACSDSTPTAQRLFPWSSISVCRPAHSFLPFFCPLSSWPPGQRAEVLKPSPFQHPAYGLPSGAFTPTPALTSRRVWPELSVSGPVLTKPHTILGVKSPFLHCILFICLQSCALTNRWASIFWAKDYRIWHAHKYSGFYYSVKTLNMILLSVFAKHNWQLHPLFCLSALDLILTLQRSDFFTSSSRPVTLGSWGRLAFSTTAANSVLWGHCWALGVTTHCGWSVSRNSVWSLGGDLRGNHHGNDINEYAEFLKCYTERLICPRPWLVLKF